MLRFLRRLPIRTLGTVLGLLGIAIILVVAVSRTQVGRDALARRLETEFADQSTGDLTIGLLTGNLLREFVAFDVTIRDRDGKTVFHADTVRVSPSWDDLVRRRFVTPRVSLHGPELEISFTNEGESNLERLFERSAERDSVRGTWDFRSAHVLVTDGRLNTRREGPADSSVVPPSWQRLSLSDLQLDVLVERTEDGIQLDVFSASVTDPGLGLGVRDLEAQIVAVDGNFQVNRGRIALDRTFVSFSGSYGTDAAGERVFQLTADSDEVSFDEVSRIWPGNPFSGSIGVAIDIAGIGRALTVSRLELSRGGSSLAGRGSAVRFADSLSFALTVDRSLLAAEDIRSLVRSRPELDALDFEALQLVTSATGGVAFHDGKLSMVRADGELEMSGDAGALNGVFDVSYEPAYRTRLQVDAQSDGLDLAAFTSGTPRTSLTGTLVVDASGLTPFDLNGNASLRLRRSRVGARLLERAEFTAFAVEDDATASLSIIQPIGRMRADMAWRRVDPSGGFVRASWTDFDIAPFALTDSVETDASGRLDIDFSGRTEADLTGHLTLVVDSTRYRFGRRTGLLLPQIVRVDLMPAASSGPRLVVDADAARVEIAGDVRLEVLSTVTPYWMGVVADAVHQLVSKPYPAEGATTDDGRVENSREIAASIRRGDLANLLAGMASSRPIRLTTRVDVRDPRLLQGWTGLAPWGGNPSFLGSIQADADSVLGDLTVSADSFRVGPLRLVGLSLDASATVRLDVPARRVMDVRLRADADSISLGALSLPDALAVVSFDDGSGRLSFETGSAGDFGPVGFDAGIDALPDRNRFSIDRLTVTARNYAWSLVRPARVDTWVDAVRIEGLTVTSPSDRNPQSISVSGAYSRAAEDSLFVDANSVLLEEITRFASLGRSLGGQLDGRIAVTGSSGRPIVIGSVHTEAFVLDGRLLGDVTVSSRLIPGTPEIGVSLDVMPSDSTAMDRSGRPSEYRRNEIHVNGTVRLPESGGEDPGEWSLSIDAPRIDLFFLKYIFTDSIDRVAGYLTGSGRVEGAYARPVFDVALRAIGGRFSVPITGVDYGLEGDVRIDRDAIRIRRAAVSDDRGGTAVATGSLLFNEYRYFSFDIEADLNRLLVLDTGYTEDLPFFGTIRGSGSATLIGPLANARLRIPDARATDNSELFIPIIETAAETDESFIVFADSAGHIPDLRRLVRRPNLLARRASVERRFLDGLDMDINLDAPRGSVVHLVIDPLLGDVINAESTGRMQIQRRQGGFEVFGRLEVQGGDYLFTAGEVFVRRFLIEGGGTITWESDPIDAVLDIPAVYRTRASTAGLESSGSATNALIPLVVELQITGRVLAPSVALRLAVDRTSQNVLGDYQALEARLNNPEKSAEYATSVLLTNSFQLTTDRIDSRSGEQLAFNSVSQLVSAQLNRFLAATIPNLDVNFGLLGERAQDLDITYGVALRLLDERLIIRGEGVYQGSRADVTNTAGESLQGEFIVEVRLSPSVSVEVFFRRESDILQTSELTNTTGAGLTYQAEFTSWRRFFRRLFGREIASPSDSASSDSPPSD